MNSTPQITPRSKFLFLIIVLSWILTGMFLVLKSRFLFFEPRSPVSSSDLFQDFSGRYYMGDGLGLNCLFDLNPDKTFKIHWTTDAGGKGDYEGSITVKDTLFVLEPNAEVQMPEPCFHRTFTPVNWGARKYLLPNEDDELSEYINSVFCRDVKSSDEPRNDIHGFSYLRTTDVTNQVTGYPVKQDGQLQCP